MTDIPVIFSGPMVLGLLREVAEPGTGKTETRRFAWTGKLAADGEGFRPSPWQKVKAGDRLWVRESAWLDREEVQGVGALRCFFEGGQVRFSDGRFGQAPGHPVSHCAEVFRLNASLKMRPSIHMPRWASRLTLTVTSTKIERLQDITEADAAAEGIATIERSLTRHGRLNGYGLAGITPPDEASTSRANAFRHLWQSLHGRESWDSNPYVVALTFRVALANIDAERAAA